MIETYLRNWFNIKDKIIKTGGSKKASEKTWHQIEMLKVE